MITSEQTQPGPDSFYRDLKAIAQRSAAQLAGAPLRTDADLCDEHGLPA